MFSELVDRAVSIAGRPDELEQIAKFCNMTMRDISKREDFPDDAIEESFMPDWSAHPHAHVPPDPFGTHNRLRPNYAHNHWTKSYSDYGRTAVWTPSVGRNRFRREDVLQDACGCKGEATKPNRKLLGVSVFSYYHSQGSLVMLNACWPVSIYYYAYQPWLAYYPKGQRPAVFDYESNSYGGAVQADVDKVSNWMLERHDEVVLAGTLARFFAAKADQRQQVHYAAYEQGISHIIRGEGTFELLARQ